jgi:RNA polymerase sigma-70 factor (ECF subfamily)
MLAEGQLIERAKAGDSAATWQLLALYRPHLQAYLKDHFPGALRSTLEPRDLLQDVYFQVFRRIGQFQQRDEDAFLRWVVTIARNLLTDALRRHQAAKRGGSNSDGLPPEDQSIVTLLEELALYKRTPSQSAAAHELMSAVEVSLQRLPDDLHMALRLRHIDGLNVDEAAIKMNRSAGAIQQLCCRAVKALRLELRSSSLYS